MKQLLQNFKTGELLMEEIPPPTLKPGGVLVQNICSLISAGTERSTVSTAQAGLIGKARQRPDLVRQVLDNVKREGIIGTYRKVRTRLESLKALGYSSAGIVCESGCDAFQPGDRVACAGGGYASHAEIIFVPRHLCAQIPETSRNRDPIGFDEAAFTTLGVIAMQGIRQAGVHIGERVAVIGLGLIGLLTVNILNAAGCHVLGADISDANAAYAERMGCDAFCLMSDLEDQAHAFSQGQGMDAVILTAGTSSNEPIAKAGAISRKKATVVVVGAVGMNIPRDPHYYQKELQIRMSTSYGPGRYDAGYEEKGLDYPIGYARWTENRNMEAFLGLMARGRLSVKPLMTHRFPFEDAVAAYDLITGKRKEPYLGVLLSYDALHEEKKRIALQDPSRIFPASEDEPMPSPDNTCCNALTPVIGFIGAGNFAQSYLIPNLKREKTLLLRAVCTASGLTASTVAKKFGFLMQSSKATDVLQDPEINTIFVATRHDSHARYVIESLKAGKHVYVEKPLCINEEEMEEILEICNARRISRGPSHLIMVGFNRRFSPLMEEMKAFFRDRSAPMAVYARVNAGCLPAEHWTHDPEVGGGRIIGEGCHFLDTFRYLINSPAKEVFARALPSSGHPPDSVCITVRYQDGSVANLAYLANGDPGVPKEYFEIHAGGRSAILDDFRVLILAANRRKKRIKRAQDKGHQREIHAFIHAVQTGGPSPIPFGEILETTRVGFAIMRSIRTGEIIALEQKDIADSSQKAAQDTCRSKGAKPKRSGGRKDTSRSKKGKSEKSGSRITPSDQRRQKEAMVVLSS
ncbi:MAG: bi-domain-containing oxidoreductase [bacterium]